MDVFICNYSDSQGFLICDKENTCQYERSVLKHCCIAVIIPCQTSKWNFCNIEAHIFRIFPGLDVSQVKRLLWLRGTLGNILKSFSDVRMSPGSDRAQTADRPDTLIISDTAHWVTNRNHLPLAWSQPLEKPSYREYLHKMDNNIFPWLARSPTSYPLESWISPTIGISRDSEEEVTDHLSGSGSDISLPRLVTRAGAGVQAVPKFVLFPVLGLWLLSTELTE